MSPRALDPASAPPHPARRRAVVVADAAAKAAGWETIEMLFASTKASPTAVRRSLLVLELRATASRRDSHHIRALVVRRLSRALETWRLADGPDALAT